MIETVSQLVELMSKNGAVRLYAKKLAPNDNSKNQVYLGGDFSVLNILPFGEVTADDSELAGSVRNRAKASVDFYWIDEDASYKAPNAQLILYPKYPEVRMSGFLSGCENPPSNVMNVRDEGRVLFLGITNDGRILGYVVFGDHPLSREIYARKDWLEVGVLLELPAGSRDQDTKSQLLTILGSIYRKNWIASQKIGRDGKAHPYRARNGGGYTLEAELGISPNGYADPDFLGWEIKQYGVQDFKKYRPKSPVTLMTPEPTGGLYKDEGVEAFMRQYGYADKSGKQDRINFGGIYSCVKEAHAETGLKLRLTGYDQGTGKISDMSGGIVLLDDTDKVAALWRFTGMIEHWNRKHAQAAYVPSLHQSPPPEYRYGPRIHLCERTDLTLFLNAIASGVVYYDPGIKLENASAERPNIKRRSQFRIRHADLAQMYHSHEVIELD
jgi:hypothetical protein